MNHPHDAREGAPDDAAPSTTDCLAAIAAGVEAMRSRDRAREPFRLVAAINRTTGPGAGPQVWELRFKAERLIPASPTDEVGAGGEVSVRVDLGSPGQAALVTHDD